MKIPALLAFLGATLLPMASSADPSAPTPPKSASIVLGGGCFWCLQAAYDMLPGVTHVTCGYAGGHTLDPLYEDVCTGTTGHAEVVKIDYNPALISLERIIDYFWLVHDPTQINGQGEDEGPQYRSIILYADPSQQAVAEASRAKAQKHFQDPIATEIVPLKRFWPAESYHQDYFAKHPNQGYCRVVIAPKVAHLREMLSETGGRPPAP